MGGRSTTLAFVVASLGPIAVAVAVVLLAPSLARASVSASAIRSGGLIGAGLGLLTGLGIGLWMTRACRNGGSAFLAPLAGGFLVKLFVLAAGTALFAMVLTEVGNHVAFALSYAAAAFTFQTLFTPALQRALRGAAV